MPDTTRQRAGSAPNRTQRSRITTWAGTLAAALTVMLAACGGSDDVPAPPAVAPTIVTQPAAVVATEGDAATFSVTANGTAPLAYQWKRGGASIAGATARSYTIAATALADNGASFSVTVSNSAGSVTSSAAALTVNARLQPVTINAAPQSVSVAELQSVTLSVTATGTAPFTYQWQRSADGTTWTDIAGATGATYTTPPLIRTDSGVRFRVIVDNAVNQPVTSSAAQITVAPDAAVLLASGGTVSGDNDGVRMIVPAGALLGATRITFTPQGAIAGLSTDWVLRAGTAYRIDISGAGFAPGATAQVLIRLAGTTPIRIQSDRVRRLAPGLEAPTQLVKKCPNGQFVFTAVAGVTPEMTAYGFETCPGGTSEVGEVSPSPAVLPQITQQPASQTVPLGQPASFSVSATGGTPLSYQWLRNGTPIPGATSPSYAMNAVGSADNAAVFSVKVSNPYGTATSADAVLTVGAPLAAQWGSATAIAPFAAGMGLPQVGGGAGLEFVAWLDAGATLRAQSLGGAYAPIDGIALPARSTPRIVSGPNQRTSYIVFVDDDGSGNCGSFNGNRLSAVAVSIGSEGQLIQNSGRFTLYSTGGCLSAWSAGRAEAGLVFAVNDISSNDVTVGTAGAYFNIVSQSPFSGSWVIPTVTTQPLARDTACNGAPILDSQSLIGFRESFAGTAVPATQAILRMVVPSVGNLCLARLDSTSPTSSAWTAAQPVLTGGACEESAGAIDGNGNALVVCSRLNPVTANYDMVAVHRAGSTGALTTQPLDSSANAALPQAAFDAGGNAFVVWRTGPTAGGTTRVYAARRAAAGTWSSAEAISPAGVDTRFPRISVLASGEAMAVFSMLDAGKFRVMATPFRFGAWESAVPVQLDTTNEGRFAEVQRQMPDASFVGHYVAWRETNAANTAQQRIVAARRDQ